MTKYTITNKFLIFFIMEALSVSSAIRSKNRDDNMSIFPDAVYKNAEEKEKINKRDLAVKDSAFYVRAKVEMGSMAADHCNSF